jgi:hypothetical protein
LAIQNSAIDLAPVDFNGARKLLKKLLNTSRGRAFVFESLSYIAFLTIGDVVYLSFIH